MRFSISLNISSFLKRSFEGLFRSLSSLEYGNKAENLEADEFFINYFSFWNYKTNLNRSHFASKTRSYLQKYSFL